MCRVLNFLQEVCWIDLEKVQFYYLKYMINDMSAVVCPQDGRIFAASHTVPCRRETLINYTLKGKHKVEKKIAK